MRTIIFLCCLYALDASGQDWGRYAGVVSIPVVQPTIQMPAMLPTVDTRMQIRIELPRPFTRATVSAMNRELAGVPIGRPITFADMARIERPPSPAGFPR